VKNKDQVNCRCRVCGSQYVVYLCDTYNEHSKTISISHFRCNECGSVFVGNDIEREEIGVAYSTLDSKKYYEEIESQNRKKMATAIRHLKRLISINDNIIDIGTGNGLFVELLKEAGFENLSAHEIQGSDLSKIKEITNHIYQDFDYSSIPSNSFNAVTLLDVVEHVIDPSYLINMCGRMLKKDGVIYFHTPVVTKTDRLMHYLQKVPVFKKAGIIWQRGRTSIFHLENYTPKSLTLLLEGAGFHDIKIKVKNELSRPLVSYVKIYLLEKQGLPSFPAPFFAPLFYPLLATDLFNANKAIVSARKKEGHPIEHPSRH
jgi:ubiquinone/menaquinone biosynthesis C-methylase UbiE